MTMVTAKNVVCQSSVSTLTRAVVMENSAIIATSVASNRSRIGSLSKQITTAITQLNIRIIIINHEKYLFLIT